MRTTPKLITHRYPFDGVQVDEFQFLGVPTVWNEGVDSPTLANNHAVHVNLAGTFCFGKSAARPAGVEIRDFLCIGNTGQVRLNNEIVFAGTGQRNAREGGTDDVVKLRTV